MFVGCSVFWEMGIWVASGVGMTIWKLCLTPYTFFFAIFDHSVMNHDFQNMQVLKVFNVLKHRGNTDLLQDLIFILHQDTLWLLPVTFTHYMYNDWCGNKSKSNSYIYLFNAVLRQISFFHSFLLAVVWASSLICFICLCCSNDKNYPLWNRIKFTFF